MLLVVVSNIGFDLSAKRGSTIVHGQENAFEEQAGVELLLNNREGLKELSEAFNRVILTLNRNEKRMACDESVEREQPERGGAVDEDQVGFRTWRIRLGCQRPEVIPERLGEPPFPDPLVSLKEVRLGSNEIAVGRDEEEPFEFGRVNGGRKGLLLNQDIVDRLRKGILIQSKA